MPPASRGKLFEKSFPLDPFQKLLKGEIVNFSNGLGKLWTSVLSLPVAQEKYGI
jgi:hypothetical protein